MSQLTLFAPDITCAHCLETIARSVDAERGARFIAGDVEGRRFSVEISDGSVLDAVAAALADEGYALGNADSVASIALAPPTGTGATRPTYRVTPTDAGAEINYDCPCGCTAGFAFNRAVAAAEPESCCCGRTMLAGRAAEERLRACLAEPEDYRFDTQTVAMPWGQPIEVALATPAEPSH